MRSGTSVQTLGPTAPDRRGDRRARGPVSQGCGEPVRRTGAPDRFADSFAFLCSPLRSHNSWEIARGAPDHSSGPVRDQDHFHMQVGGRRFAPIQCRGCGQIFMVDTSTSRREFLGGGYSTMAGFFAAEQPAYWMGKKDQETCGSSL